MRAAEYVVSTIRPYQFRGKFRLLDPLVPHVGERTAVVFGYRMELDLSRRVQRDVYIGNYERRETRMVSSLLKPGMTVVDAGANIGYYSALAARMVGPTGRVFAVEPYPPNFQRLERWIRENGVTQLQAFNFALGASAGSSKMFSACTDTDNPVMIPHGQPSVCSVTVKTLDSCLDDWHVDGIDFLKIDVEGFEPRVLAGAARALAMRHIRTVLCEFSRTWLMRIGSCTADLWRTFLGAGFTPIWPGPAMPTSDLFTAAFVLDY